MIWFVVVLITLVAAGSGVELYMIRNDLGGGLRRAIAGVVGWSLERCAVPIEVVGTQVNVADGQIEIAVDCTGIRATAIFWAGVLAFPCAWRAKWIGLLTGLIGVGLLNIRRIATLGLIVGYRYEWFESVHAVLMQGFLIVFVAPLWIAWMYWTLKRETKLHQAPNQPILADG